MRALDRYLWAGHRALLGTIPCPRQETAAILAHFGPTRRRAVAAYAGGAVVQLVGVHPPAIYRAAQRGQTDRARWDGLLDSEERRRNLRRQRPG